MKPPPINKHEQMVLHFELKNSIDSPKITITDVVCMRSHSLHTSHGKRNYIAHF